MNQVEFNNLEWKNTCNTNLGFMVSKVKQAYLFLIFFFRGESSSDPFLPLPRGPLFSLSPLPPSGRMIRKWSVMCDLQ